MVRVHVSIILYITWFNFVIVAERAFVVVAVLISLAISSCRLCRFSILFRLNFDCPSISFQHNPCIWLQCKKINVDNMLKKQLKFSRAYVHVFCSRHLKKFDCPVMWYDADHHDHTKPLNKIRFNGISGTNIHWVWIQSFVCWFNLVRKQKIYSWQIKKKTKKHNLKTNTEREGAIARYSTIVPLSKNHTPHAFVIGFEMKKR